VFGGVPQAKFLVPLNVQDDDQIAHVMHLTADTFGTIDFLLHSIAFADRDDLNRPTVETSRSGFQLAMDISVYSLIAVTNAAKGIMNRRAAIAAMTYFGGEKCVPGYNVMGICKSALEASVRYLAYDLGPRGIRVNALSAGPLKTLGRVGSRGERDVAAVPIHVADGQEHHPQRGGSDGRFSAVGHVGWDHGRDVARRWRVQHHGLAGPIAGGVA
jgi:enoyl-[acyl-carrier-protein] reductase (NADH)